MSPDASQNGLRDSAYAARFFGRSVEWVQKETRAGRLHGAKIGRHYRYTDAQLDEYVATNRLDEGAA